MPLLRFEDELTLIDTSKLQEYSEYYDKQIKGCEERVRNAVR